MAADDETLMDVFIGIQPKPDFLASVDRMADEASKRLIQKFGSLKLPGPQMAGPVVINVAADQERTRLLKEQETITRKIADTEERIAKAKSNRGNRNTPAAEEKAAKALADAQKEMLRNEEALQALYRQNPYLKQMADVNAIADQILKHSEDRKRAEKEQRVLIQQTEQAQLKLNKLQGDGAIKFTQSMVDEARARAAAANAAVVARQKSLDEADTPLKTKRRATALGEAQEAARQAEREAAEIEAKRAGSVGRRGEQRAIAEKNVADALALQAAGAQRLQEIDARAIVTATELAQKRLLAVQAFEESERKAADAQAKLSSIQANVGPVTAAKQKELNDATEEFNRLQRERAQVGQQLIDVEKQLSVAVVETANASEKAPKEAAKKTSKSSKDVENQQKIVALQKQEEANRASILEIDKKIEIARKVLGSKDPNSVGAERQAAKIAEYEQQKINALEEQERLVRRIEAIQSGDGGRRGGGRRGGSGAGDGGDASGLRDAYRAAIREAEDLRVVTSQIYKTLGDTGSPLAQTLEIAKNRVDQILVSLRRGAQDKDPLGLEPTIENLRRVRTEIEGNLRGQTIGATFRNSLAQELVKANRAVGEEDQIRFQLRQSLTQGVAFSDKEAIRGATADVNVAQKEFNRLAQEIDGSQAALDRLIASYIKLNGVRELTPEQIGALQSVSSVPILGGGIDTNAGLRAQRAALQADASTRNFSSTNTLSNNAYQLGQAIEDFSVGYSLNGFAGGVRGAANNVAFLLNNLSQSDRFVSSLANGFVKVRGVIPVDKAKQMAEQFALAIPLIAGIGSAMAIVILPKLVEWLESLNDIEVGFKDISDRINRDFSDLKFRVELEADERRFLRTIDQAKELKDLLSQLSDAARTGEDAKIDLGKLFGDPKVIKDQSDAIKQLLESRVFAEDALGALRNKLSLDDTAKKLSGVPGFGGGAFVQLNKEQKAAIEQQVTEYAKLDSTIKTIVLDIQDVNREGQKGIFDTAKLNRIVDSFFEIEGLYNILKEADLAKPELVDALKATLDATRGTVEEYRKAAQQIDSVNNKILFGLEAARRKTRELAQEQILITQIIKGDSNSGILDSFSIVQFVNEQAAAIEKVRNEALKLEAVRNNPQAEANVNATADELREALRFETINSLLLRRKDIEEQINDLQNKRNGNSELTSLEKISQDLIKSQLSVDDESKKAFKDLTEQLQILNTTISIMNANISGAGGTLEMATRTVPFGGGSATALGAAIDFSAMSFMMRDAIEAGVRAAMQGQQKPVVEVLEKVNNGVNRINAGAQN